MNKKTRQYNYGECEICDANMVEERIKSDFWIGGKLVVINNVPAGVCSRCGAKVVWSKTSSRLAAILQSPKKWLKASVMSVPVVELR